MARVSADSVLSLMDQRLVVALQWDGRLAAERAAHVLGAPPTWEPAAARAPPAR
ncbi:hypothetical protein [Streptomyces sp. NPDC005784]|uniref:hypothetical protein n=1 Tax=Streptomyces sp. NPDC005784 TaxID=3364731 RepID=UPI0036C92CD4